MHACVRLRMSVYLHASAYARLGNLDTFVATCDMG